MHVYAASGAGFLIAVLWFDLMFDVQAARRGNVLAKGVLDSISAYYRRVTTEAAPMGRLVAVVMLGTVAAIAFGLVQGQTPLLVGAASLSLAFLGMGLAIVRTVPTAQRLGRGADPPEVMTKLARQTLTDHLISLAAMVSLLTLQCVSPS